MASVDEMRKKYFTVDGVNALSVRLKNLVKLYEKPITYPFIGKMYGFIDLSITSQNAHLAQINELRQILGIPYIEVIEKDEYGRSQKKTVK